MGAGQSKAESDEHFSEEVVNNLSDNLASPDTPPERQSSLDAHIRSRIQVELARLREEEEHVREEIERALEKENLDRERDMAGDETDSGVGQVKSTTALLGDVDELRKQVERFHSKKDDDDFVAARLKSEAVVQCYKNNPSTTLDCWKQVDEFKASVAHLEERYVESLR
ncbi:hypothetical protein GLOTRDRAFT_127009 [Gloeophyllum trabeum ATCC 11539]|uniref:DUF1690-domain-containing protein n=1 Tax=Gloeophyllum trabeum (strain ATCC 11539 / FP-39264 / Madison 617) TaxID=670483 RepID=S7RYP8_GLOTA|nr:uncharacterized protein GLOTRDRAFT_127009 [Gloeophyllum trabeum ATCC 11539]EPQ58514.1 hypothetical protein GLOTRDRAFT_127009 [Gloeophyllum trabeum ATCC 11539]